MFTHLPNLTVAIFYTPETCDKSISCKIAHSQIVTGLKGTQQCTLSVVLYQVITFSYEKVFLG